jgi:hypothetical protein
MAALVERSGEWDNPVMDLVPEFMPNLASWPHNRGLVVIDERPGRDIAMMRFASGANPTYQLTSAPDLQTDVVVRRRGGNHYELLQANHAAPIQMPRDGDCFFRAVALGLNTLEGGNAFSVRGLRTASARYIRQNSQMFSFMETPPLLSGVEPMIENLLGMYSEGSFPKGLRQTSCSNRFAYTWMQRRMRHPLRLQHSGIDLKGFPTCCPRGIAMVWHGCASRIRLSN